MRPSLLKYLKTGYYISKNILRREGTYPFYASLKVTSRCILNCRFCYLTGSSTLSDLDTDSMKKIIDKLSKTSVLILTIEGGEPLLRNDLQEILVHASRYPFFISIVTSYPVEIGDSCANLGKYIDFLQLSIDEEHDNLELFQKIPQIKASWNTRVCVQSVVSQSTLDRIEEKVLLAQKAYAKILFLPVCEANNGYADLIKSRAAFASAIRGLKKRFPSTVLASSYFLNSYETGKGCTSSSIIIDSDGSIFYPCHILAEKPWRFETEDLADFFLSKRASLLRQRMKDCDKGCGWYQYFSISASSLSAIGKDFVSGIERF